MNPDPGATAVALPRPHVGFAIGACGLGVTALGWIADRWGLASALWISAVMPLGGFVVALRVPEARAR